VRILSQPEQLGGLAFRPRFPDFIRADRGTHAEIVCENCHQQPVAPGEKLAIPRDCATCHGLDDPHRDASGSDCARCHGPSSWKEVRISR